jgi:hypothetical protein
MSKTYRKADSGQLTGDGGRHYATPRYRDGSRGKPHRVVARGVPLADPDLERFGQAVVRAVLFEAGRQTDHATTRPVRPLQDRARPTPARPKGRP